MTIPLITNGVTNSEDAADRVNAAIEFANNFPDTIAQWWIDIKQEPLIWQEAILGDLRIGQSNYWFGASELSTKPYPFSLDYGLHFSLPPPVSGEYYYIKIYGYLSETSNNVNIIDLSAVYNHDVSKVKAINNSTVKHTLAIKKSTTGELWLHIDVPVGLYDIQLIVDIATNADVVDLNDIGFLTHTYPTDIATTYTIYQALHTPSSATDVGNKGEMRFDDNYIYACIADNTWKRAALTSW